MMIRATVSGKSGLSDSPVWWRAAPGAPAAPALRLFCFPYSGASATAFHGWQRALGPSVEVCPVELPGHGRRIGEPLYRRMDALADAAAAGLASHVEGPWAVFGHSLGALLGYEVARRLAARNAPPSLFIASGHEAPHRQTRPRVLHTLPEEDLVVLLRTLNGTPEEALAHPELRAMVLPILRADLEVCDRYTHESGPRLACSLVAYGGLGDEDVGRPSLEAWADLTDGPFRLRLFPGGHFFIQSARQAVLDAVARDLATITGGA